MWEGMTHREPAQAGQTHFLETKHGAMVTRGGRISPRKRQVRVPCWGAAEGSENRINKWEEGKIGNERRQKMPSGAVGEGKL